VLFPARAVTCIVHLRYVRVVRWARACANGRPCLLLALTIHSPSCDFTSLRAAARRVGLRSLMPVPRMSFEAPPSAGLSHFLFVHAADPSTSLPRSLFRSPPFPIRPLPAATRLKHTIGAAVNDAPVAGDPAPTCELTWLSTKKIVKFTLEALAPQTTDAVELAGLLSCLANAAAYGPSVTRSARCDRCRFCSLYLVFLLVVLRPVGEEMFDAAWPAGCRASSRFVRHLKVCMHVSLSVTAQSHKD